MSPICLKTVTVWLGQVELCEVKGVTVYMSGSRSAKATRETLSQKTNKLTNKPLQLYNPTALLEVKTPIHGHI